MGKLLSLLGGWQGYLASAAVAAIIAAGATFYVTSLGYRLTIAQMQRDRANQAVTAANAALKQFETDAQAIRGAAGVFNETRDALDAKIATISKGFTTVVHDAPLPPDCKPDAERMRILSSAVAATNTAAGYSAGATVPAHP